MSSYMYGEPACNGEQIASCRAAAISGQLNSYEASGSCMVKQYVQYTHLCTINNYLPSVDHCCCSLSTDRLLCCRYHQDRHHYRCTDTDDVIDIRSNGEVCWQTIMTSWQVLVIVIILSLLVVVLTAVVIVCCCRHKLPTRCRRSVRPTSNMDQPETSTIQQETFTCWPCCAGLNLVSKKSNVQSPTRSVRSTSRSSPAANQTTSSAVLSYFNSETSPLEPSAPMYCPASNFVDGDNDVINVPLSEPNVTCTSTSSPSDRRLQGNCSIFSSNNEYTVQDRWADLAPPPYCVMATNNAELSSSSACAHCLLLPNSGPLPASNLHDQDQPPTYELSQRLHLQS